MSEQPASNLRTEWWGSQDAQAFVTELAELIGLPYPVWDEGFGMLLLQGLKNNPFHMFLTDHQGSSEYWNPLYSEADAFLLQAYYRVDLRFYEHTATSSIIDGGFVVATLNESRVLCHVTPMLPVNEAMRKAITLAVYEHLKANKKD